MGSIFIIQPFEESQIRFTTTSLSWLKQEHRAHNKMGLDTEIKLKEFQILDLETFSAIQDPKI